MITTLYGKNTLLLTRELELVKQKLEARGLKYEIANFNGNDARFDAQAFFMALDSGSLFSDVRLLIYRNPLGMDSKQSMSDDMIQSWTKVLDHQADVELVLIGAQHFDRKKKIVKRLEKESEVRDTTLLYNADDLFRSLLDRYGLKMDSETQNYLLKRLNHDDSRYDNELLKLRTYSETITMADVDALVSWSYEDQIFELAKAILNHSFAYAYSIYRVLKQLKHDEMELIAIVATSVRTIFQCRVLLSRGESQDEVAALLGLKSGRVWHIQNEYGMMRAADLLAVLARLSRADQAIKSGKFDKNLAFEMFLIGEA